MQMHINSIPSMTQDVKITYEFDVFVANVGRTKGSAMAEGPRDAVVSRNSVTTKHPI